MSPHLYTHARARPLTYDAYLAGFSADTLKRLARFWVGKAAYKMNKDACAQALVQVLSNPEAVRAVTERFSEFERAGLGLIKWRGQTAGKQELAVELLMLGLPFQERLRGYGRGESELYNALQSLLNHGLVLFRDNDSFTHANLFVGHNSRAAEVFSDPRILHHIEPVPPAPLNIASISGTQAELFQRPAEVMLRFIALAETLRKLGPVEFNRTGLVAKPYMAKLTRTLGWDDPLAKEPHTPLFEATLFFFALFIAGALLRLGPDGTSIVLSPEADDGFKRPFEDQAKMWVAAYRSMTGWIEYKPDSVWIYRDAPSEPGKFNSLRAALLLALGALPDPAGWYRLTDLSEAIYDRIGERFCFGHFPNFWLAYNARPEQVKKEYAKWQKEVHDKWGKNEQPWILRAITGPLFHLGLVELAFEPGRAKEAPALLRLTEIGRAALYDVFRSAARAVERPPAVRHPAADEAPKTCWVVQPNFDVVVYLDRASATRLAFLERIAERKPSHGPIASYHLSGETVYRGLESGIPPETLITTLNEASDYLLPENVRRTLADWVARRERITVYRATDVLEFPDPAARDAALADASGFGTPLGDRFIRLSGRKVKRETLGNRSHTVDYHGPPVRCVTVEENGHIRVDHAQADLLVRGELAGWAEPDSEDGDYWRITRASIQRAVRSGWKVESMLAGLTSRARHPIPQLLLVAVRAWAEVGPELVSAAIATDVVLQVANEEVAAALAASTILRPYLKGRLGAKTFLVRPERAAELRRKLEEFGLGVGHDLAIISPKV